MLLDNYDKKQTRILIIYSLFHSLNFCNFIYNYKYKFTKYSEQKSNSLYIFFNKFFKNFKEIYTNKKYSIFLKILC